MFKTILKILAAALAAVAAFAAFSWLDQSRPSEYIEIYSDDEDF